MLIQNNLKFEDEFQKVKVTLDLLSKEEARNAKKNVPHVKSRDTKQPIAGKTRKTQTSNKRIGLLV